MTETNKNNFYRLFTEVISELSNQNYSSTEFKEKLSCLFPKIAKVFNISKVKVKIIEHGKQQSNFILYDDKERIENFYEFKECISDTIQIKVKYYSPEGFSYTNKECEYIDLLSKTIFMLYGKLFAENIINNAYKIDSSIGIPNNIGIMEFGSELSESNKLQNFDAVFFNIKDFKFVSKLVGAENVNETLKTFINEIRKNFVKDELIGRLGGDNFFALIKKERITDFIEKLSNIEININNEPVHIKSRMGIYEMQPGDSVGDGIEGASVALLTVRKQREKLYCFFNDEMRQNLLRTREITYRFEQALENDEFDVFYQPKVDINTGELIGAEALVRWTTQELSPAIFVPILEQENLIEKLDFYVLEHVCNDIKKWESSGLEPVTISTNFSRNNLKDEYLSDNIVSVVKKFDVDTKYLEAEITESATIDGTEELINLIKELKSKNIKVSLDDFGTGYSSLNMIKNMDVDTIKIDKSFIDHFEQDKDKIIITNIINMINQLNINVIVEGVETQEQIDFLRLIGCNNVQGYYFDKPLSESIFEKRLINRNYFELEKIKVQK